ncbi:MAG: hypothetical protein WBX11_03090 [Thiobacillaceae bacterium]|jgi:hypothetical protein
MKLPKLSPAEILALRAPGQEKTCGLTDLVKAHLTACLRTHVRVEVRALSSPVRIDEGESPRMQADDELLAAWVAARFGVVDVNQVVPAYHGESLLEKMRQALAMLVLGDKLGGLSSLCLEIQLNGQYGKLEIDWGDMAPGELKEWAVRQWVAR